MRYAETKNWIRFAVNLAIICHGGLSAIDVQTYIQQKKIDESTIFDLEHEVEYGENKPAHQELYVHTGLAMRFDSTNKQQAMVNWQVFLLSYFNAYDNAGIDHAIKFDGTEFEFESLRPHFADAAARKYVRLKGLAYLRDKKYDFKKKGFLLDGIYPFTNIGFGYYANKKLNIQLKDEKFANMIALTNAYFFEVEQAKAAEAKEKIEHNNGNGASYLGYVPVTCLFKIGKPTSKKLDYYVCGSSVREETFCADILKKTTKFKSLPVTIEICELR